MRRGGRRQTTWSTDTADVTASVDRWRRAQEREKWKRIEELLPTLVAEEVQVIVAEEIRLVATVKDRITLIAYTLLYYIGEILHTPRRITPILYRKDFAYPTQNYSHII